MKSAYSSSSPVVIGGVGGSGTRIVAEIVMRLGYYFGYPGSDLNVASDNLWFTLLFKRPAWFKGFSVQDEMIIYRNLRVFEKLMTGEPLSGRERMLVISLATSFSGFDQYDDKRSKRGLSKFKRDANWRLTRIKNTLRPRKSGTKTSIGWGWKEPNTHIYLEHLSLYFHNLKYIHVVRNGLDMAFSKNQSQLYNWGPLFGIDLRDSALSLSQASLSYWIRANQRALELGSSLLGERFLMVNFDELCVNPQTELLALIRFLGLDASQIDLQGLANLPKKPSSTNRYKTHDLGVFSEQDIEAVRQLGFKVEEIGNS